MTLILCVIVQHPQMRDVAPGITPHAFLLLCTNANTRLTNENHLPMEVLPNIHIQEGIEY